MKYFLSIVFLVLAACSGGGGGSDKGADSSPDPIYGEWYYENPKSTNASIVGFVVKIESDGKIDFVDGIMTRAGNSWQAFMRRSIGTFTRNGNTFSIKYTYETCGPLGEETLIFTVVNGKLLAQTSDKSYQVSLSPLSQYAAVKTANYIEDTNCSILSKAEKSDKRKIASAKPKTLQDRSKK